MARLFLELYNGLAKLTQITNLYHQTFSNMQTHVINKIGVLIITLCIFITLFLFKFLALEINSKFLITAILGLSGVSFISYARYKEQDITYFLKVGFGLLTIIVMIAFYFFIIR